MLIFWIVDLAIVTHLTKRWRAPGCTYDLRHENICAVGKKRSLDDNQTTPFNAFYGALVAGAVLAAFEL
jgi:hypothetical protein